MSDVMPQRDDTRIERITLRSYPRSYLHDKSQIRLVLFTLGK